MPSASGTQLSAAPQRQRHGQATRSRSGRGSERTSARPAESVSVCCGGPARNASAISGSKPAGSATPHQPKASVRPSRERATRRRCGATSFPGCTSPSTVKAASAVRVPEEIPAVAARTIPVTASGRRTAARSATSPPSECPTQGTDTASSCSSTASTASANGSSVGAAGSGPESPWPGSSGTITRRSRASGGATRRQFAAAPPSPCTSTSGGPEPATR